MKKIKINTKLSLNKEIVSKLNFTQLSNIKGGTGAGPCYSMPVCGPREPKITEASCPNGTGGYNPNGGGDGFGYVEQ
jgi:hypothetical protein